MQLTALRAAADRPEALGRQMMVVASRVFRSVALLAIVAAGGCSTPSSASIARPCLYVGQGVGGCVGFYVVDGAVTGGFALPGKPWVGSTHAWPIRRVSSLGDDTYRVFTLGGDPPQLGSFLLVVREVDEAALFYRLSLEGSADDVAFSGTAVNVDRIAGKLNAVEARSDG